MLVAIRQLTITLLIVIVPALALGTFMLERLKGRHWRNRALLALVAGVCLAGSYWIVATGLLVRHDLLQREAIWLLIAATLASSAVVVLGPKRRAFGDLIRTSVAEARSLGSAWLLIAAPSVVLIPFLSHILQRPNSLISPTSWYYWLGITQAAELGGIPGSVFEWGTSVASFDYHTGFVSTSAALHLIGNDMSSMATPQLLRVAAVVLTTLGVMFLAWTLGAGVTTVAASSFGLLAVSIYAIKLSSLRPEALAYGPVFLALGLIALGLRHYDHILIIIGAVTFAASTQIHGVGATFGASVLAGILGGSLFTYPKGALRNRLMLVLSTSVILLITVLTFGFLVSGRATPASSLGQTPELGENGYDATFAFVQLSSTGLGPNETLGFSAPDQRELFMRGLESGWMNLSDKTSLGAAALIFGVLAIGSIRSRETRRSLAILTIAVVCVVGLSLLISAGWPTYVPRRTGYQRVLQLWFLIVILGAALLPQVARSRRSRAMIASLVLIGAGLVWGNAIPAIDQLRTAQPDQKSMQALRSAIVPPGNIVLTNGWTQGYITYHTAGFGLLDGHAPYLEPELLERANHLLKQSRAYFADPTGAPFPFEHYGVDVVLVATERYALGTPSNFPTDIDGVIGDPRLSQEGEFPGFLAFRVRDS